MRPTECTERGQLVEQCIDQIQRRWWKSRDTVVDKLNREQAELEDDAWPSFIFAKSEGTWSYLDSYIYQTTTTVLRPLCRSTCVSRQLQNWRILLVQNFTACMSLLMVTSAFGLKKRCWSSQQCYLHCLHTLDSHVTIKHLLILYSSSAIKLPSI